MRRIAFLAALLALVLAAPAPADVRIDGRGWGHGIGMSQYGAYGYALVEHRSFRWSSGTTTRERASPPRPGRGCASASRRGAGTA